MDLDHGFREKKDASPFRLVFKSRITHQIFRKNSLIKLNCYLGLCKVGVVFCCLWLGTVSDLFSSFGLVVVLYLP